MISNTHMRSPENFADIRAAFQLHVAEVVEELRASGSFARNLQVVINYIDGRGFVARIDDITDGIPERVSRIPLAQLELPVTREGAPVPQRAGRLLLGGELLALHMAEVIGGNLNKVWDPDEEDFTSYVGTLQKIANKKYEWPPRKT